MRLSHEHSHPLTTASREPNRPPRRPRRSRWRPRRTPSEPRRHCHVGARESFISSLVVAVDRWDDSRGRPGGPGGVPRRRLAGDPSSPVGVGCPWVCPPLHVPRLSHRNGTPPWWPVWASTVKEPPYRQLFPPGQPVEHIALATTASPHALIVTGSAAHVLGLRTGAKIASFTFAGDLRAVTACGPYAVIAAAGRGTATEASVPSDVRRIPLHPELVAILRRTSMDSRHV